MLARPTPYVAWFFASAVLLAISCMVDPHVFGLAAFVAAAINAGLLLVAPWFGLRAIIWTLAASVPTIAAFAVLSTYNWA